MTVTTISRRRATRDDLTAQGLWEFFDVLESRGHAVTLVEQPANDRHLLVEAADGRVFKLTGYGKDDLVVALFDSFGEYDENDGATREESGLSERDVLDVLADRRDLIAA